MCDYVDLVEEGVHIPSSEIVPGHPRYVSDDDEESASDDEDDKKDEEEEEHKEKIETLNARVLHIRENMGKYVQLGSHPGFKKVQKQLKLCGYKACTSLICAHPVQPLESGFYNEHRSLCTKCEKKPAAVSAAAEQQKHKARAVVDATKGKTLKIEVETEAINNCLVPLHVAAGINCLVNFEFRTADTMARRESWMAPPGVYLGQQVKSDGLYKECKEDGDKVRKSNNSKSRNGGGRAHFSDCKGYESMAMIFVKSRFVDATSDEIVRTIWVVDGALVTNEQLAENVDGTLGPQRFAPLPTGSAAEFGAALDALVMGEAQKPLVLLETLLRQVKDLNQRKEMHLMYACKVLFTVVFEPGNQNVIDCLINGVSTQVKTHTLKSGKANMTHKVNGIDGQKYTERDHLGQFLIGCVVKSGGKFYLMHALLSRHELMLNKVLCHNGYRGMPPSAGNSNVCLRGGIYANWLTKYVNRTDTRTEWLLEPRNMWRAPVELFPDDPVHGLSLADLEEVAQEAHNPAAFPSKESIDRDTEMLQQSLATAAEEAAEEAAPSAAVNNVNNTTVNNININITNVHIHTDEPASKRQCLNSFLDTFGIRAVPQLRMLYFPPGCVATTMPDGSTIVMKK